MAKRTSKRKKKNEIVEKIEDNVSVNDEVTVKVEQTDNEYEDFKKYIKKLEKKIKDLESKIEKIVDTYKPYNLDFMGKEVIVVSINNNNKIIIKPGDKLALSPNNIYVFELDKEYNNIQLNEPFDYIFEIVSFNGKRVKIKPRSNYVLKNNLPVFLVK